MQGRPVTTIGAVRALWQRAVGGVPLRLGLSASGAALLATIAMDAGYGTVAYLVPIWLLGLVPTRRARDVVAAGLVLTTGIAFAAPSPSDALLPVLSALWATLLFAFVTSLRRRADDRHHLADDAHRRLAEELVQSEERTRLNLGATLHDGPLQLILAAGQDLDEVDDPEAEHARSLLRRAAREIRELLAGVEPGAADHHHLRAQLEDWSLLLSQRYGFAYRVDVSPAIDRADALVLSIARELVTNAARHARASELTVSVQPAVLTGGVVVTVVDDGVGLQATQGGSDPGGYGLPALQRRIAAVGGVLHLLSSSPGGTTAVASLPAGSPATRAADGGRFPRADARRDRLAS